MHWVAIPTLSLMGHFDKLTELSAFSTVARAARAFFTTLSSALIQFPPPFLCFFPFVFLFNLVSSSLASSGAA